MGTPTVLNILNILSLLINGNNLVPYRKISRFLSLISSIPFPPIPLSKPHHSDFCLFIFVSVYDYKYTHTHTHTHTCSWTHMGIKTIGEATKMWDLGPFPTFLIESWFYSHIFLPPYGLVLQRNIEEWDLSGLKVNHEVPLWLHDFWYTCMMKFWPLRPKEKFTDRNWVWGFRKRFPCS